MSRSYSPSTVFRMADSSLLRDLFAAFGADVNLEDWNRLTVQKVGLLMSLKETLPPSNKDRLESTLIKIHSLSCPEGMQAISDAFESVLPDDYECSCPILTGNGKISSGKTVVISRNMKTGKWQIIAAECES